MRTSISPVGKFVGFIDLGTNSVRLLVIKINSNFSYNILTQEKEVVRLGENEFKDNILRKQAMDRTIIVCKKFVELAHTYGAEKIIAVGTSAIREAKNREQILERLRNEVGLEVQIILGKEEARLIYLGVSSFIDIGNKKTIFIDLGGGSTEIAIGDQRRIYYLESLRLGAIRLTTRYIGEGWIGPVPDDAYKQIKKNIVENIQSIKDSVLEYGARIAYGTSGTMINLAEITSKLFKKGENNSSNCLTRKNIKKLVPILRSLSLKERKDLPGINPDRADLIVAGATIVETIMDEFGLEEIHISRRELRDGLLVDYLSNFEGFQQLQKSPIRSRSVLHLGRSSNFDEKHSEKVAELSLQLFDSAKNLGLHNYGDYERELLSYAAMLHDVGDFISFANHHLHSYYIINNADLYGFTQKEKNIIANIAKYHRKKIPRKKALKNKGLDEQSKNIIIALSAFVRLAEKLDRSHSGVVKKVEFKKSGKNKITLVLYADTDCNLEEWSILQNKQAFYESFEEDLDAHCVIKNSIKQS